MPKDRGSDEPAETSLRGSIDAIAEQEDGVVLTLTLRNHADRPLHYISDVRALNVDNATGEVRVRLSEAGLEIPPGGFFVEPRVRAIDPNSDATLTVRLPRTILKLSSDPAPDGEARFEELPVAGAPSISVDIGWSETPYYADRRRETDVRNPVAAWEDTQLRVEMENRRQKR